MLDLVTNTNIFLDSLKWFIRKFKAACLQQKKGHCGLFLPNTQPLRKLKTNHNKRAARKKKIKPAENLPNFKKKPNHPNKYTPPPKKKKPQTLNLLHI